MNKLQNELNNLYDRIMKEKNRRKYSKRFEDNIRRIIADINLLSDIYADEIKSLSKGKIPSKLELDWIDPIEIEKLVESGYDPVEIAEYQKNYEYEDEDYERVFKQLKNAVNVCANVVRLTLKEIQLIKSNKNVIKTEKNQEKVKNQIESERLAQKQENSNKDKKDEMTFF